METTTFLQSKSLFSTLKQTQLQRHKHILKPSSTIASVLTRPADHNIVIETESTDSKGRGRAENTSTIYNDNWFDRIAINHLSQSVQAATGLRNEKSGYESLVEAATAVSKNFDPIKQRELVKQALRTAFPRQLLFMIKTLLPQSKLTREYFAVFTTLFFAWLIGPCEVRESEFNGRREKNVVHIKKCRFLVESNCVGMCTNLCMIPSQTFIKDSLGMQVNMVPNFEDMSCEMKFGEEPPAFIDDPALKRPCYKLCKVNRRHHTNCSS